jgi:hypothetical protein
MRAEKWAAAIVVIGIPGALMAQSFLGNVLGGLFRGGLGMPVNDASANMKLTEELSVSGTQLEQERGIRSATQTISGWLGQIFSSKLGWQTATRAAQKSTIPDQYGETAGWNEAMSTGGMGSVAWSNASVALHSTVPLLLGTPLGTNKMAQLATIEAIKGAGANNLATIGQARGWMDQNQPAMRLLQNMIADSSRFTNSPTQQMALTANATAQGANVATQSLQVQTGTLEALTGLTKALGDAATANLNLHTDAAVTRETEPTAIGGFAQAFMTHP